MRAGLESDEQALTREHDRVEGERAELERRVQATLQRCTEIEGETRSEEEAAAALELEASSARRNRERLMREARRLDGELQACRDQLSAAESTLEAATGSMIRMDYKLRHGTRAGE